MSKTVIIAGGRDFNDHTLLKSSVNEICDCHDINIKEIVSGGARGADYHGKLYGDTMGIPVTVMKADWGKFGKRAGILRNHEMGDYAHRDNNGVLIAFWDGISTGTKDMISYAKSIGMEVHVVKYKS